MNANVIPFPVSPEQYLADLNEQIAFAEARLAALVGLIGIVGPPPKVDRVAGILREACAKFGITKVDLQGAGRPDVAVNARRYAAKHLRDELGLSFPRIGMLLGRDHTTAMHAYATYWKAAEWLSMKEASA